MSEMDSRQDRARDFADRRQVPGVGSAEPRVSSVAGAGSREGSGRSWA